MECDVKNAFGTFVYSAEYSCKILFRSAFCSLCILTLTWFQSVNLISGQLVVYVASYDTFSCPSNVERQETFRPGRQCVCCVVMHYITTLPVMILRTELEGEVSETTSMFHRNCSIQEGTKCILLFSCRYSSTLL
jgi:hypothetical protein